MFRVYIIKTIVLLLSAVVFISCDSNNTAQTLADDEKEDVLISETLNLNVVLSQYGKKRQTVKAAITQQYLGKEGQYTIFPAGIYIESFTDSLILESTIAAKYARIKDGRTDRERFYSAYDSVVVTNYLQNTKIISDTLYWDRPNGKIYNYCFTKCSFQSGDFNALNGLTATENLSDWEIRTIREGDMIMERKSKSDSINTYSITFPDTVDDAQRQQQNQIQTQAQPQQLQRQPQQPRIFSPDRNVDRNREQRPKPEPRKRNVELQKTDLAK